MKEVKVNTEDGKVIVVDMRRYILTVASSLMTKNGIKETSLKDIAKEAGISKGTLYYYYSAKDDIIYDIADTNLSDITNEIFKFLDESTENVEARQVIKTFFERVLSDETRGKLHMYLLNDVSNNPALKEKFFHRYETWRDMCENTLNKIFHDGADHRSLATVILAVLDGLLIQKSCGCPDVDMEQIANALLP